MLIDAKRLLTMMLPISAAFAFAFASGVAAQSAPLPAGNGFPGNVRIVDQKELRRNDPFARLHDQPLSESPGIIPALLADVDTNPPAYLYELARRLWPTDRDAAFEWLALGMARARYDALRCTDKTSRQGIAYLAMIAPDVIKGSEQDRQAFGDAGKRALARSNLFVDAISPLWICSHGMATMTAALQGKKLTERDWLRPSAEWPALRDEVSRDLARYFDEQGKPQDDPVPMTQTPYPRQPVPGAFGHYAWLDSQRLVIVAGAKNDDGKFVRRLAIVGMDGRREEVGVASGIWCAANGVISYQTGSEKLDNRVERLGFSAGQPGKWANQTVDLQRPYLDAAAEQTFSQSWSLPVNSARQSPFDCRWETSETLSGPRNATQWLPLLPGDGAIQFDPPGAGLTPQRVSWVAADGTSQRLPLAAQRLSLGSFRYFSERQAYFAAPLWSRFGPDGTQPPACVAAVWLHPQQRRIEEVCIPFDTANTSNAVMFSPVRNGWLRVASDRNTAHGPKPGGLYLVRADGQTEKLVAAHIDNWNVSPDGCRVAFRQRPVGTAASTLEIIDLCPSP